MGLQVPNTVNFFDGKMIVTDASADGTTAGRVLSFDVPQSAYLGTLTVRHPPCSGYPCLNVDLWSAHSAYKAPSASATASFAADSKACLHCILLCRRSCCLSCSGR